MRIWFRIMLLLRYLSHARPDCYFVGVQHSVTLSVLIS